MLPKVLVAASVRPLVLSVLRRGPTYGYAVVQQIKELSGGEIQWSDGTIYPVLHKLETEGLVDHTWSQSDSGRRRKYYSLTPQGEAAFEMERSQWVGVNDILLKLWGMEPQLT